MIVRHCSWPKGCGASPKTKLEWDRMCAALIRVVLAATFNRQAFSRTKRTKYSMFECSRHASLVHVSVAKLILESTIFV